MSVRISREALDAVLAEAAGAEGEVCGLLLSSPFAPSLSKGCPPSSSAEEERTGLRQARPEREEGIERGGESDESGGGERIVQAAPTANAAADPARAFEIDPAALFAAIRAERAGGSRIVGHYHSHPNGLTSPSPRDAAMADKPGRLWLIVARGRANLWREQPDGPVQHAFAPVRLVVDEGEDGCA